MEKEKEEQTSLFFTSPFEFQRAEEKKKSEKTRFLFHFSFAPFQLPTLFVFSPKRWRA